MEILMATPLIMIFILYCFYRHYRFISRKYFLFIIHKAGNRTRLWIKKIM